jgi:hypothetical protein
MNKSFSHHQNLKSVEKYPLRNLFSFVQKIENKQQKKKAACIDNKKKLGSIQA